jgi:DNA-binding SARP family transcriptional activator/tetratricopeptide (TPR) repeat protein
MLTFHLLGPPIIQCDGVPLRLKPESIRGRALLIYLAMAGQPVERSRLAGLLYSDQNEAEARANLRVALFRVRKAAGEVLVDAGYALALRPGAYELDLTTVERQLAEPAANAAALHQLLLHWRGELLEGLDEALGAKSGLFGQWLGAERSHWNRLHHQLRLHLAAACIAERTLLAAGIAACAQVLEDEPTHEEAHRLKMHLLGLEGRRAEARKQYAELSRLLRELGQTPSPESDAVDEQIEDGRIGPPPVSSGLLRSRRYLPPAPPPHFTGRRRESEELLARLTAPMAPGRSAPVVALVGMGGIGKTTLAAAVAARLSGRTVARVLWAPVATADPMDILQSWAILFERDISAITALDARASTIRTLLAGERALLVLDDLVTGRPVDALLPGAPACPVLITTRDRALAAAYTNTIVELEELTAGEALQLLEKVIGAERIHAQPAAAAELCLLTGGLPLAVEITAQRLVAAPRPNLPRAVTALRTAGGLLSAEIASRSVRASFEAGWPELDEALRRAFAQLALFGSRSFDAATFAAVSASPAAVAEERLERLAMLSLLKPVGETRYYVHPLLAEFADHKLAGEPALANGARSRFVSYYVQLAQRLGSRHNANGAEVSLAEEEWEHLLTAFAVAGADERWPMIVELADALIPVWVESGRFADARRALPFAIAAAETLADAGHRARYAYQLGHTLMRSDEYAAAKRWFAAAAGDFAQAGDALALAQIDIDLCDIALQQERLDEVEPLLARAQATYAAQAIGSGLAAVHARRAKLYFQQDRFEPAEQEAARGLALLRTSASHSEHNLLLMLLVDILLIQKRVDDARQLVDELEALQPLCPAEDRAVGQVALAKIAFYSGALDQAMKLTVAATVTFSRGGDLRSAALANLRAGDIHRAQGLENIARRDYEQSRQWAQQIGDQSLQALCEQRINPAPA